MTSFSWIFCLKQTTACSLPDGFGKKKRPVEIIFISCSRDYAIESYDVSPLHYLLKPVQSEALESALNRFLDKTTSQSICFAAPKGGLLHIHIADITYFEIYGHEIVIHIKNGTTESYTGTLKNMERLLPPMSFVRPHRSYLVSLRHAAFSCRELA